LAGAATAAGDGFAVALSDAGFADVLPAEEACEAAAAIAVADGVAGTGVSAGRGAAHEASIKADRSGMVDMFFMEVDGVA
jgi:hypothetical protein